MICILTDFKNTTRRLSRNIFSIKNSKVMNFNALYSLIKVVYTLKNKLLSDNFNVLKPSSIEDMGHLFNETIGISLIFCCFHQLQTDKMIVFDNLIRHPHYRRIKKYAVSTLNLVFYFGKF